MKQIDKKKKNAEMGTNVKCFFNVLNMNKNLKIIITTFQGEKKRVYIVFNCLFQMSITALLTRK